MVNKIQYFQYLEESTKRKMKRVARKADFSENYKTKNIYFKMKKTKEFEFVKG